MTSKFASLNMENGLRGFLSRLLVNNTQSEFVQYLKFYLANFQYFVIVLWGQSTLLSNSDRDQFSNFFVKLCDILFIRNLFKTYPDTYLYIVMLIITWFYFISITIAFVFVSIRYIFNLGPMEVYYRGLYKVLRFHFAVMFWIFNMVLMTTLSTNSESEVYLWTETSQNQGVRIISIIFIIYNYVIGIASALLCFTPLPEQKIFAAHSTSCQFVIFFFKAVMAPVVGFMDPNILFTRILFVIVAFLISTGRCIVLLQLFPYYYPIAMVLSGIMSSTGAWLSFVNVPIVFFNKTAINFTTMLYIDFLILPIAIKFVLVQLERWTRHFITADPSTLRSEEQVFRKLYTFAFLREKVNLPLNGVWTAEENLFFGKLITHSRTCRNKKCPCRMFTLDSTHISDEAIVENGSRDRATALIEYQNLWLFRFFSSAVQNIKRNDNLKITLAHLIFKHQEQGIITALTYLFSTSERLDFFIKIKKNIVTLNVQDHISRFFTERRNAVLNLKEYIDFHHSRSSFMQLLTSNTQKYLNFWDLYKNSDVKIVEVLKQSIEIEKEATQIEKIWYQHFQKYDEFCNILKEPYCAYLSQVRNTPAASQSIMKKLVWKHHLKKNNDSSLVQIVPEDLMSPEIVSLYVSVTKDKLGKVLYASNNVSSILGYHPEELKEKPIDLLMPPSIAEKHRDILLRYLEKSKTSEARDYVSIVSYIRTKKGNILPCYFYVSIFPYVQTELVFLTCIKVIYSKYELILYDSKGLMDSFSEKVGQDLNLSLSRKNHITEMCLDTNNLHATIGPFPRKSMDCESKRSSTDRDRKKNPVQKFAALTTSKTMKAVFLNAESAFEQNYDENSSFIVSFLKQDYLKDANHTPIYFKYRIKIVQTTLLDVKVHALLMEPYTIQNTERVKIETPETKYGKWPMETANTLMGANTLMIANTLMGTNTQMLADTLMITNNNIDSNFEAEDSQDVGDDLPLYNTNPLGKKGQKDFMFIKKNLTQEGLPYTTEPLETIEGKALMQTLKSEVKAETEQGQAKSIGEKQVEYDLNSGFNMNGTSSRDVEVAKVDDIRSEKEFSNAASNNLNSKFEQAVYAVTKSKTKKIVQNIALSLLFICVLLHLIFYFNKKTNVDLLNGNTNVLRGSNMRLYELIELNRRARSVSLVLDGYFQDSRFSQYLIPSVLYVFSYAITAIQEGLLDYNNLVRNSLYKIEPSLQTQFYNRAIPVIQGSPMAVTRHSDSFDLITDLVVAGGRLAKLSPMNFTSNNPDMLMILYNTLGELFIDGEQINTIVTKDNQYKFQSLKSLIMYFLAVVIVLAIGILFFYFKEASKIRLNRTKLIEIFLRLNTHDIENSLQEVKALHTLLATEASEYKTFTTKKSGVSVKYSSKKKDSSTVGFKLRKKDANMRGIDLNLMFARIFATLFAIVCLTPFVTEVILIDAQNTSLNEKIQNIVEFDTHFYNIDLLITTFYQYVHNNGTGTVKEVAINTEWEDNYQKLLVSQDFISKIVSSSGNPSSESMIALNNLLTGDICVLAPYPNISDASCYVIGHEMIKKGIIGLNNYILVSLRQAKDYYDSSNKTFAAAVETLNMKSLPSIDLLTSLWFPLAYQKASDLLLKIVVSDIESIITIQSILLAMYIIFTIIFGLLTLRHVWRYVEEERVEWKKVLRKIPFSVLLVNKALKNYLVKESGYVMNNMDV